ncbi:MAG: hypothetical protein S4CHLAM81_00050 [Chlamydiales bacterium]|nr:hypothetical protein [Chlamydiales bacterium]MCH9634809.1 hypothetical protein [Chlamydiales bacterium]MCH9703511.1 hypothetical protein [Chlamydiota bacterium]
MASPVVRGEQSHFEVRKKRAHQGMTASVALAVIMAAGAAYLMYSGNIAQFANKAYCVAGLSASVGAMAATAGAIYLAIYARRQHPEVAGEVEEIDDPQPQPPVNLNNILDEINTSEGLAGHAQRDDLFDHIFTERQDRVGLVTPGAVFVRLRNKAEHRQEIVAQMTQEQIEAIRNANQHVGVRLIMHNLPEGDLDAKYQSLFAYAGGQSTFSEFAKANHTRKQALDLFFDHINDGLEGRFAILQNGRKDSSKRLAQAGNMEEVRQYYQDQELPKVFQK